MDRKAMPQHARSDAQRIDRETGAAIKVSVDLICEDAQKLVEVARFKLRAGPTRLRLDLGEVRAMDSSGLRALIQVNRMCDEAGVAFELASISPCVARVITISGLGRVFGIERLPTAAEPDRPRTANRPVYVEWKTYEHVADSDPSLVAVLREAVAKAAIDAGADGDTLCDIRIAVGEALANAYKHGSVNKGVDKIWLRCMTCPEALVVEVKDQGEPFDTESRFVPDPNKMQDHGMGIHLMRKAMDVVEFRTGCPGNQVRMIKWLEPRSEDRD